MKIVRNRDLAFVPASHENPNQPGVLKKVIATKADLVNGQVQMLNWSLCPDQSSFRLHYHEDMQETFVILNGTVVMEVDGHAFTLEAGDTIIIEPREVHKMTNECGEDVNYLVFGIATFQDGKTVVVGD